MMRSKLALALIVGLSFHGICSAQDGSTAVALEAVGDRFPIHITYFPANPDAGPPKDAPVVVIVPDLEETRIAWDKGAGPRNAPKTLPAELQQRGYAVITVDLRKSGESVIEGREEPIRPTDYERMVLGDLEAVKEFIFTLHQEQKLNMRKLGVIGSGLGAPIAAGFAEFDWKRKPFDDHAIPAERTPRGQDVRAIVMISPKTSAGKVHSNRAIGFLKNPRMNISLMVIVGQDDTQNYRNAKAIFNTFAVVKANEDRAVFLEPRLKDSGIGLLQQRIEIAYTPILTFLDNRLKSINDPWVDRRSRLQR
ncbi:alpha/beta hydrolase [Thalassoglobus neptunius]|nr:alpha/beta hydrolase [Thalassoglobus neptunius]